MPCALLASFRVVSTALNLPGPAACARLRRWGAAVVKVEPPSGDPLATYAPAFYRRLHEGVDVRVLDLKSGAGREAMAALLADADLLVTAQRPSALARLGLDAEGLAQRHPRLRHVAITGHAPPGEERPGHDLTYLAGQALLSPPGLPATLFADMAGAERAVSTALALLLDRASGGNLRSALVPLEEAAAHLAEPLVAGLTRPGGLLGGAHAGYNVYATRSGWIAVAALEPHFGRRLAEALGLEALDAPSLAARFSEDTAENWARWAAERGLPLVAVKPIPFPPAEQP